MPNNWYSLFFPFVIVLNGFPQKEYNRMKNLYSTEIHFFVQNEENSQYRERLPYFFDRPLYRILY